MLALSANLIAFDKHTIDTRCYNLMHTLTRNRYRTYLGASAPACLYGITDPHGTIDTTPWPFTTIPSDLNISNTRYRCNFFLDGALMTSHTRRPKYDFGLYAPYLFP